MNQMKHDERNPMTIPSKTYKPAHGGYPGTEPGWAINFDLLGYPARYYDEEYDQSFPVGTRVEEHLASLAQAKPDTIYFVREEALS